MSMKIERRHIWGKSIVRSNNDIKKKTKTKIYPGTVGSKNNFPIISKTNTRKQNQSRKEYAQFCADSNNLNIISDENRKQTFLIRHNGNSLTREEFKHKKTNEKTHSLLASKDFVSKNVEVETQLVSNTKHVKPTPSDKCSISKVLDFRMLMKRRYFYNKELSKIFLNWTHTEKNVIHPRDIELMSKCVGFQLNNKEAELLITLATHGVSNQMECTDFCGLIYQDEYFAEIMKENSKNSNLTEDILRKSIQKADKTINDIALSKHLQKEFASLKEDTVPIDVFMKKVSKPQFLNDLGFQRAVEEYVIKNTNENKRVSLKSLLSVETSTQNDINIQINDEEKLESLLLKNKRELPINQFEQNYLKITKLRYKICGRGGSKQQFEQQLKQSNIGEFVKPFDLRKELSMYINNLGFEQNTDLLNYVFLHLSPETNGLVSVDKALNCLFTEDYKNFVHRQNLLPRKQISEWGGLADDQQSENVDPNLPVLHSMRKKILQKHSAMYDVFRALDVDKDGLLSRQDVESYMNNIFKLSGSDARIVSQYLDQENKGAINYEQFVKKIQKINKHEYLIENDRVTNIFGLKQYDPKINHSKLSDYFKFFGSLREQFKVSGILDNCLLIRLFWTR